MKIMTQSGIELSGERLYSLIDLAENGGRFTPDVRTHAALIYMKTENPQILFVSGVRQRRERDCGIDE